MNKADSPSTTHNIVEEFAKPNGKGPTNPPIANLVLLDLEVIKLNTTSAMPAKIRKNPIPARDSFI